MSNKTNASLMKRREAAVPRGVGQIHPIFAESAKNATVTDVEGREFLVGRVVRRGDGGKGCFQDAQRRAEGRERGRDGVISFLC